MTPNERLASHLESLLAAGEMGNLGARGAAYEALLERTFGRGKELRSKQTSCAIFQGAAMIDCGLQPRRGWPSALGITTWLGPGFSFSSKGWVRRGDDGKLDVRRGDILYWCSNEGQITFGGKVYKWTTWTGALNGHVGATLVGAGKMWVTAEGGGSPGGTMCRKSAAAKDVFATSRRLQGLWRPDLVYAEAKPVAPPSWQDIKPGMRGVMVKAWQQVLLRWRPDCLPKWGADGAYGLKLDSETLLATKAFQSARGLPDTGIVDRLTWEAGEQP